MQDKFLHNEKNNHDQDIAVSLALQTSRILILK